MRRMHFLQEAVEDFRPVDLQLPIEHLLGAGEILYPGDFVVPALLNDRAQLCDSCNLLCKGGLG